MRRSPFVFFYQACWRKKPLPETEIWAHRIVNTPLGRAFCACAAWGKNALHSLCRPRRAKGGAKKTE